MDRKQFLNKSLSGFGLMAISPMLLACSKDTVDTSGTSAATSATGSTNGSSASDCVVTPSETEGPFPTRKPATLAIQNIKSDRTGTPMMANITIKNKNTSCAALKGATVDIWHCDADGSYSEYGGSGMQSINYTAVSFLRGRQSTDANGLVSFETIFPGWYSGRAVHIHVHIYDASGKSLLVTQIAFPPAICDTVFTTVTSIYKKGKADTTNERDNVFSDGFTTELGTIAGNTKDGIILNHTIVVSA